MPLISDEMRAYVGSEGEPWTLEVSRSGVRMFARATGQVDPVYYDVAAARAAGYRDLPAPPGFFGASVFPAGVTDPMYARDAKAPLPSPPLTRGLAGGVEYEYFADVCAGDVLTCSIQVTGYEERASSLGPTLLMKTTWTFRNERGELVAHRLNTRIQY